MEIDGLTEVPEPLYRQLDRHYNSNAARDKVQVAFEDETTHIHKTASGVEIPLYNMEDEHLINTISYHARNLARSIKENGQLFGQETMLDAIMTGKLQREHKVANIRRTISDGYMVLGRYAVEALRRGKHVEAVEAGRPYFDAINELMGVNPKGEDIPKIIIKEMEDE